MPGGHAVEKLGGALLILAGATILMAIVTGEALFPAAYSTSQNTISDLGSTWQPGGIVREPAATIFNTAMLVSGLMVVAAAVTYWRAHRSRSVATVLLLLGVGMLGVGIFPGIEIGGHPSSGGLHPPLSMLTFVAGGLCGVLAYRVTTAPFRYVSVALGLVSLGSLVLSGPLAASELGAGGVERWVVYPVVLWVVAFGGYLLGAGASAQVKSAGQRPTRQRDAR
ncbi:MAG: hypothetical protein QOK21_229 [Solirubrobacteraceae bacterium]|jgi:hypothetical membrane protein|nr:hypothetical protein [Solirubrobacteraceae bacterium]